MKTPPTADALAGVFTSHRQFEMHPADVATVMGTYNKFRGQFCTHNDYLVNKILKGDWGFKGLVMSDWGAVYSATEALLYGTDLEMATDLVLNGNSVSQTAVGSLPIPKTVYDRFFLADSAIYLVNSGKIPVAVIDDKVKRILRGNVQSKHIQ